MITRTHIHKGRPYIFEYTECDSFEHLTDAPVRQVRSVTYCRGKFVIVQNNDSDFGYPGGTLEEGETIEMALNRELLEETGCKMVWWKPLGVQKVTEESGKVYYQVRVLSEVQFGDFEGDPDGGIAACIHVSLDEMQEKVDWKEIGDAMVTKSLTILKERGLDINNF